MDLLTVEQISELDMQQPKSTTEMSIKIHKPYVLIKDRPYLDTNFEVDLGQLTISILEREVKGRVKLAPQKTLLQSQFLIDCKEVSIKYSHDKFLVAPPFDLKVTFGNLVRTDFLHMIDSNQLDKFYEIDIEFQPHFNLRLREDIYTFLLRCVDLNFGYSDNLEQKFMFSNEPEYFRS